MGYNFHSFDRDQMYLMPPSVSDWLPKDHLAWFVIDAVSQIDLGSFYESYRSDGVGNTAFHPEMMVALLVYAYCNGERSSRRIEEYCQTNIAYKVITANQKPDHSTISRFRQKNSAHLKKLFLEICLSRKYTEFTGCLHLPFQTTANPSGCRRSIISIRF